MLFLLSVAKNVVLAVVTVYAAAKLVGATITYLAEYERKEYVCHWNWATAEYMYSADPHEIAERDVRYGRVNSRSGFY